MSVLSTGIGASGVDVGDIGHSLRLRSSASAYLSRTFGTPAAQNTWTLSFWVKQAGSIGTTTAGGLFARKVDTQNFESIAFDPNGTDANKLGIFTRTTSGTNNRRATSDALYRDPISWQHIVVVKSVSQSSSAPAFYVNGVSVNVPTRSSAGTPQDFLNAAAAHVIGQDAQSASTSDFYLARYCFVDGTALTPTSFGYQNTTINEWVSKSQSAVKAVVDAGGTNSFMLDFDDGTSTTTLGYDKSSKGNNWTLNNVSLTAGSTYDWMLDVPENSFCTASPIDLGANPSSSTLSEANLKSVCAAVSGGSSTCGTQALPAGKWYWEYVPTAIGNGLILGITSRTSGAPSGTAVGYVFDGNKNVGGTGSAYGASYAANDVIGVAVDTTANTIEFFKNNTSQGVITNATYVVPGCKPVHWNNSSSGSSTVQHMYGQAPLHASATYQSAAGGYFRYAPPSGYKALCQRNMPDPAILNPELHFDVKLDTGANIKTTSEAVFPSNFFEWIKDRANANNHQLIDTVRGSSAVLQSNTTAAETTYSAPSGSSVGWAWKAGGAPVANNDGTIPAQVSANVLAGQSVVTYVGNGGTATIGHGLTRAPELIHVKSRDDAIDGWYGYHASLGPTKGIFLNLTSAAITSSAYWNDTAPTTSVFTVKGTGVTNRNGDDYVALCFHSVPGFSKVFSYTGNGSADGPFVECGFKPKFILMKNTTAGNGWIIWDTVRDTYNVVGAYLQPNASAAEGFAGYLDVTASGFKVRTANADANNSTNTIIGIAFADVPAKYSLAR